MTTKRFTLKSLFALMLAVLLLGCASVSSSAADSFTNLKGKYGLIVPTDINLKAQKKSYTFYGDEGQLYFMRISTGKTGSKFAVEIFADSSLTNKIRHFSDNYNAKPGNKALAIRWNFRDVKSGTYYGRCYTYYETQDGNKTIDSSSLEAFTISINRVGKKEVKITSIKNVVDGVQVSWKSLPTAEKYYVYRKTATAKSWTRIATLPASRTSYVDAKANSGNRYTYTVKCFDGKYNSLYNKKGVSIVFLDSPVLKSTGGTGAAGYANLTWSAVDGATGYRVYRKGGNLSDYQWKLIATIKNGKTTSYTDKKATSTDWHYSYTVRATNSSSVSSFYSSGIDFDYTAAPKLAKIYPYDTGMRIEWSSNNDNVVKYYVYRKKGTSWTRIGETRQKYFIDTKASSGSTYTYTVKALTENNAGAYNSKGITGKFIGTPELSNITFNSANASVVKWSKVKGAVGYRVYRKINNAAKWSFVKTVVGNANTTFIDTIKKASSAKLTYTVRAYDSKGLLGYYSTKGKTGIFLSAPVVTANQLFGEGEGLKVSLSWKAVPGATGYHVYRRIPGSGWTYLAKNTPETTFVDSTVVNGQVYDYTARAITNSGDISKYIAVSAYAATVPVLDSVTVTEEGVNLAWTPADGATGYVVYRALKDNGEWVKAGIVTEEGVCTFTDTDATALTDAYYYAVSAMVNSVEGAKSNKIGSFVEINATAVFNAETLSIDLSWEATDSTTVTIYKAAEGEEASVLAEELQFVSTFSDQFILEGLQYTYTLTAKQDGKLSAVSVVSAKYPHPPLAQAIIKSVNKTETTDVAACVVNWGAVEFADEYVILRAEGDSEYIEIGKVTKAEALENGDFSFTDTEVPADGTYSYVIKAIATESERDESVSESVSVVVYRQLSSLADLTYSSTKTDNGIAVFLSWSPTELAEKYIIVRTTVATKKTVSVKEILPDQGFEGVEPTLSTGFVDETAEENVRYIYRVLATAENRGTVYNEAEFCYGTAYAYYTNYNYEKTQVEALLGDSNLDENGKENFVNEVYAEVKASFDEITASIVEQLPEDKQADIDAAERALRELKETLAANKYVRVTFNDLDGVTLIEQTVIAGTAFEDIQAPLLSANEPYAYVGWVDSSDTLILKGFAVAENITLTPAREEAKLVLKSDAAIEIIDGYINVSQGTTAEEIKAQLNNDLSYITVTNHLGEAMADDALVGTSTKISLVSKYTGVVNQSASAVVSADLDGNGIIDENDRLVMVEASANAEETFTFNGEYNHAFFLAADLMADGTLDNFDLSKMNELV